HCACTRASKDNDVRPASCEISNGAWKKLRDHTTFVVRSRLFQIHSASVNGNARIHIVPEVGFYHCVGRRNYYANSPISTSSAPPRFKRSTLNGRHGLTVTTRQ